jgi:hypothetical protein
LVCSEKVSGLGAVLLVGADLQELGAALEVALLDRVGVQPGVDLALIHHGKKSVLTNLTSVIIPTTDVNKSRVSNATEKSTRPRPHRTLILKRDNHHYISCPPDDDLTHRYRKDRRLQNRH